MISTHLLTIICVLFVAGVVAYFVTHAVTALWDWAWGHKLGPTARLMEQQTHWVALIVSFSTTLGLMLLMFDMLGV